MHYVFGAYPEGEAVIANTRVAKLDLDGYVIDAEAEYKQPGMVSQAVINLDRTRTLDQTFARSYEEENSLPGYAKDIPDYYVQLKAPVRVLEETTGGAKVARYVEAEADHFAHAENYCMVASMDTGLRKRVRAY